MRLEMECIIHGSKAWALCLARPIKRESRRKERVSVNFNHSSKHFFRTRTQKSIIVPSFTYRMVGLDWIGLDSIKMSYKWVVEHCYQLIQKILEGIARKARRGLVDRAFQHEGASRTEWLVLLLSSSTKANFEIGSYFFSLHPQKWISRLEVICD